MQMVFWLGNLCNYLVFLLTSSPCPSHTQTLNLILTVKVHFIYGLWHQLPWRPCCGVTGWKVLTNNSLSDLCERKLSDLLGKLTAVSWQAQDGVRWGKAAGLMHSLYMFCGLLPSSAHVFTPMEQEMHTAQIVRFTVSVIACNRKKNKPQTSGKQSDCISLQVHITHL